MYCGTDVGHLIVLLCSISRLPVPIVTVLKNMTVILTAIGDYIFFGQAVSREIALVLLLMVRCDQCNSRTLLMCKLSVTDVECARHNAAHDSGWRLCWVCECVCECVWGLSHSSLTCVFGFLSLTAFDGTGFTWMIINIAAAAMYTVCCRIGTVAL